MEEVCSILVDLHSKVGVFYRNMPASGKDIALTASHVIQNGICLIGNGATAGGMIQPWIFNSQFIIGTILFWNSRTVSGFNILGAMIAEFNHYGVTHVSAASHPPDDRIAKLYRKWGMEPTETNHVLALSKISCQSAEPVV